MARSSEALVRVALTVAVALLVVWALAGASTLSDTVSVVVKP